jgi:hypothetical protein
MKSLQSLIREYGQAREHFGYCECRNRIIEEDLGKAGNAELEKDEKRASADVSKAWQAICRVLEIQV